VARLFRKSFTALSSAISAPTSRAAGPSHLLSGGGLRREGEGPSPVQQFRLGLGLGVVGAMSVVWSGVLVLTGCIGLFSVDFLLPVVLQWLKPQTERGCAATISVNKSVVMLKPQTERGSCLGGVLQCR
jgi:hypothetical protein